MLTLERRFHFATCSLIVRARRSLQALWNPAALTRSLIWEIRFSSLFHGESEPMVIKGRAHDIQQLHQAVNHYLTSTFLSPAAVLQTLPSTSPQEAASSSPATASTAPTLAARGLVAHDLACGSLVGSQPQLTLSATQLADLASALDTYAAAQQAQTLWQRTQPFPWRPIAMGSVMVTLMGTAGFVYWQRNRPIAPVISSAPVETPPNRPPVLDVLPPPPLDVPTPLPSPELPDDLAKLKPIAPPSGVTAPNRPGVPDGGVIRLPSTDGQIQQQLPAPSTASRPPTSRPTVSRPPVSRPPTSRPPVSRPASPTSTGATPPPTRVPPAATRPAPTQPRTTPPLPPSPPSLPPTPSVPSLPPLIAQADSDAGIWAGNESAVETPSTPDKPGATTVTAPISLPDIAPSARSTPPQPSKPTANAPTTIPQVTEVQQYFAQRSRSSLVPTAGVAYHLTVGADGTLVRFRPLDTASTDYLEQLSMPRLGEPFVSSLASPHRQAEIRLDVNSDGQVTTRLNKLQ